MTAGRPTDYTEELVDKFLALVSEGDSVHMICQREDMPSKSSIFKWLAEYREFADKYYYAKKLSADSDADKIQDISQKTLEGHYDPQAARVAMTGFMWSASRKEPRKYGDRIETHHSGAIGVTELSDDDLARIAAGSG